MRARASLALPEPERIADLMPDAPGTGTAELGDIASLLQLPRTLFADATSEGPRDLLHPNAQGVNRGGASNVWAATPARSAAGGTLMASDPHVTLSAPSNWYLARLELSSGGVIGATIPGMPGVLNGRTDRLSWGITAAYLDDIDFYVEELNPDNPQQYRTIDGWAEFETRR